MSPAQFRFARRLISGETLPLARYRTQFAPLRSFLRKGFVAASGRDGFWALTPEGREAYLRDLGPKHRAEAVTRAKQNGFGTPDELLG